MEVTHCENTANITLIKVSAEHQMTRLFVAPLFTEQLKTACAVKKIQR